MGGKGVWKVESQPGGDLLVQHAAAADAPERLPFDEFLARCETYFACGRPMVDQPFQERLPEGMIRVYLNRDAFPEFAIAHGCTRSPRPDPHQLSRRVNTPDI